MGQELRHIRAVLIPPATFLRCIQLLAAGVASEGPPFPPAARLVSGEAVQSGGAVLFVLLLEDASFSAVRVISADGRLSPVGDAIPSTALRLNEAQTPRAPLPIEDSQREAASPGLGLRVSRETRHFLTYAVSPPSVLRLLCVLGSGVPFSIPPFPSEMVLVYSGYGSDGKFFLICEHPSFQAIPVEIEREDGLIAAVRGRIPQVTLDLDEPV